MVRPVRARDVNRAESSMRKCIRPLASGLRLQPGHDEICTRRSQLNTPGKLPAFAYRAYDTSIDFLVIGPRASQSVQAAMLRPDLCARKVHQVSSGSPRRCVPALLPMRLSPC